MLRKMVRRVGSGEGSNEDGPANLPSENLIDEDCSCEDCSCEEGSCEDGPLKRVSVNLFL